MAVGFWIGKPNLQDEKIMEKDMERKPVTIHSAHYSEHCINSDFQHMRISDGSSDLQNRNVKNLHHCF